jgi:hypothetical protein
MERVQYLHNGTTADAAFCVSAADFDRDGKVDVLSASRYDDKIVWYKNGGSWTLLQE